ncbi:MAG: AraC family transcriptional regulator [Eubacteriales bacterium]
MLKQKTFHRYNDKFTKRLSCELAVDGINEIVRLSKVDVKSVSGIMEPHTHDGAFEITYHLKGKQNYSIYNKDGSITDNIISGGDIFITYPDELHGTGSYYEDVSSFYYFIIYLDSSFDNFFNLNKEECKYFINSFIEKRPRHIKAPAYIKQDFERIITIYRDPIVSPLDKVIIQNTFFKTLCDIKDSINIYTNRTYHEIIEIKDFIDINIFLKFHISDLAHKCHLSESNFKRKFKECFGIPPIEYIIRTKIGKSKEYLKYSNLSITEIAMLFNFCSSSYFCEMFKKYILTTPLEYRNS